MTNPVKNNRRFWKPISQETIRRQRGNCWWTKAFKKERKEKRQKGRGYCSLCFEKWWSEWWLCKVREVRLGIRGSWRPKEQGFLHEDCKAEEESHEGERPGIHETWMKIRLLVGGREGLLTIVMIWEKISRQGIWNSMIFWREFLLSLCTPVKKRLD